MTASLPVPQIVPLDRETLERRARDLARGDAGEDRSAGLLRLVAFSLCNRPCAVEALGIERAVALGTPISLPLADGSECAVAFVDERPIAVVDLAGASAGTARRAPELAGAPALVVQTAGGSVAVVVDGPLELAEDRLAAASGADGAAETPRLAGRLAGGASLVDMAWLAAWAGKAARP